jgi:hypothetical protein
VQASRIYPFSTWSLLGPAFILWLCSMVLSLNLCGSADSGAAKVGASLLPLDLLLLAVLAAAAFLHRPYLSVAEHGLTMRLPFSTRTYLWNDIGSVYLEESTRRPIIRIQLRDGATRLVPPSLIDPLGAYASIQSRQESAGPAA